MYLLTHQVALRIKASTLLTPARAQEHNVSVTNSGTSVVADDVNLKKNCVDMYNDFQGRNMIALQFAIENNLTGVCTLSCVLKLCNSNKEK